MSNSHTFSSKQTNIRTTLSIFFSFLIFFEGVTAIEMAEGTPPNNDIISPENLNLIEIR